jgi:hypothetical protein
METFRTKSEAKEDIPTVDAVFELQWEFLQSEIDDIMELKGLVGVKLSDINSELAPKVLKRGPLGLLLMDGKSEIVESEIARWSAYFSKNIDDLLKVLNLLPNYPDQERQVVLHAYKMAVEITSALGQSLMSKAKRETVNAI